MKHLVLTLVLVILQSSALAVIKSDKLERILVALGEEKLAIDHTYRVFDQMVRSGTFSEREAQEIRKKMDFSGFLPEAVRFFEKEMTDADVDAMWGFFGDPLNVALYEKLAYTATSKNKRDFSRLKAETMRSDPERWKRAEKHFRSPVAARFQAARTKFEPELLEFTRKTLMKAVEASI